MLTIKKDLSMYDFIDEFSGLDNVSFTDEYEALSIIYDSLCASYDNMEEVTARDYLRFQVQEMDQDYFIEQYEHLLKLEEDADEDEKHEEIKRVLNYYTYYIGSYEHDGQTYYLFDKF